jgi:Uncharacterised nucleotidyltransferase
VTAASTPDEIISAVGAYGLPGARPLVAAALDDVTWRVVLDGATRDRLTPLLAGAVADGALPTSARQHDQAIVAHEQAMRLCVLLERALVDVAEVLDASGITFRVLKGPAVAHLDYADPAQRAFGDVDVLVEASAYDAALEVLRAAGARRRFTEVRPGFDRRFGKGACLVTPDGTQIDVHRTFVAGPFGLTIDLNELLATPRWFTIGGRAVAALDRENRLLHACFHAALGDQVARPVALRDVAQLILTTDVNRAEVIARAERWRADGVVARAVRLTWSRLVLAPDPWADWAAGHQADRFQTRALRAYTAESRSYATQVTAGLAAVRGVPEKVAYVRALLVTNPEHLAQRDQTYPRRIHRAWQAFVSTRGAR